MPPHIRINLYQDGTATYFRWVPTPGTAMEEGDGEYDFDNPIPPREAMKLLSEGATIDLTASDPDNNDRVFANLTILKLSAI